MLSKHGKIMWILGLLILVLVSFNVVTIAKDSITITWMSENHHEPQIKAVRGKLIQEFEELHPNVFIMQIQPPLEGQWMKFSIMARAGITPDIMDLGCEYLGSAVDRGWVLNLDKYVAEEDKENMSKNALNAGKVDGKIYGWPFWGGIYGMYYNKRFVIEAGLNPDNLPETWDEFLDWAKKMNNPPVYGYAGIWSSGTLFHHHLARLYSNGGDILNDDYTKCLLDQPEAVEALSFWTELDSKHKVIPPGPTTYTYQEQTRAFAYELAASMTNALWAMPKLLGDNPEAMTDNILIGQNPYRTVPATYAKILYQVIGANSENPDIAWEFIKYLNTFEAATQRAIEAKWIPFRTDVINAPEVQDSEDLKQFLGFMETAKTNPNVPQIGEIQSRIIEMVQMVLTGQATPEEASIEATKDIDKMLAK